MNTLHAERVEMLREHITPVLPDDTMSEAARKALLHDLIQMLQHEEGSRTGADIEDVHDMRVATRRVRSVLRLLAPYFKTKTIDHYQRSLRKVARALGRVRDLDVLLEDLHRFAETQPDEGNAALQPLFETLNADRDEARKALNTALDKSEYAHFVEAFAQFVSTPGAGAKATDSDGIAPSKAQHVLPVEIYSHLATIRAYDSAIEDAEPAMLHALRIEFKQLRYLLAVFEEILDKPGREFLKELKAIQDHLGRLNDTHVAQERLHDLQTRLDETGATALQRYLDALAAEETTLQASFPGVWKRFNSKTVQRGLASAMAGL